MTITATEYKNNLGKYFDWIAENHEDLYVTKNGKIAMVISNPEKNALTALENLIHLAEKSALSEMSDSQIRAMHIEDRYGEYFD